MRLLLNKGVGNGHRILKEETIAQMSVNNIGNLLVGKLKTAIPFLSRDAECFPGLPKTWGFGFMINMSETPTGRSAGSVAWAELRNTYFWIDPSRNLGGLAMMQVLPIVDQPSLDTFYNFETATCAAMT